mmetsp:Transcript_29573/g.64266  ORF Transcript_29573/g.64266 Transcript_29573/m.64266 type:complete len:476 (-) Transcript_29573:276-1703(-)|eukprot:CAMPEP_0170600676 /NCGR_PEP_ID=MMETSP0224-20130122/17457_1 /TAXON_ID=285029 /ORGANISM="Togula jolla, Strain CCCM 725" /LENGTH=475 /DNA_ID=CAMNT_0010925409 /DNA_START=54 /DNA_END=1481 /DNA_ORIENTATION=-
MPGRKSALACGAVAGGLAWGSHAFLAPLRAPPSTPMTAAEVRRSEASPLPAKEAPTPGWGMAAGAALGVAGALFFQRSRASIKAEADVEAGVSSCRMAKTTWGFIGGGASARISSGLSVGRMRAGRSRPLSALSAGGDTKVAINGFGRIGRNVLRCWLSREEKPFDLIAINAGSMDAATAAHLLKYDTVLGTLGVEVSHSDDELIVDGHHLKLLYGRDPMEMPWKYMGIEVIIEATGAFNSLEGGTKHITAGARKVVLTAPGKDCPTFVIGVNEGSYDPAHDTVVSNASCTTNGMASVCKVLDENFGVDYGMMTTVHSYTSDQQILDGRHKDLRRARAGALNIVPTSTGAAQAVSSVLPQFKGKLNGIALRVPTPNVSVIDLVMKVRKKCTREDVNSALQAAAEGPMKGIINFETAPLVSSDFLQSDYSTSVDAELTMVMGGDLMKVVLWYDNEWGYSQRVIDLTQIVAACLPLE